MNDSTWIEVDGDQYEGVILTTEFRRPVVWAGDNGEPPTVEEVEQFESLLSDEITESGIETVPEFESVTDRLPTYKRYYYAEVFKTSDNDVSHLDLPAEDVNPIYRRELEGERVIVALFSTTRGEDWKQQFSNDTVEGVTSDNFYALYMPDAEVFWLEFGLDSSTDGSYH